MKKPPFNLQLGISSAAAALSPRSALALSRPARIQSLSISVDVQSITRPVMKSLVRQRRVQEEIETNRTQRAEALERFDRVAIEDGDLEPLQSEIEKLDSEFELLNRQALTLSEADGSEYMAALAQAVLAENERLLKELQGEWSQQVESLQKCIQRYLRTVRKASSIYKKGRIPLNRRAPAPKQN